jgi:hypothetical protein
VAAHALFLPNLHGWLEREARRNEHAIINVIAMYGFQLAGELIKPESASRTAVVRQAKREIK